MFTVPLCLSQCHIKISIIIIISERNTHTFNKMNQTFVIILILLFPAFLYKHHSSYYNFNPIATAGYKLRISFEVVWQSNF